MLVKLLPEQVPKHWEIISRSVVEAYPPFVKLTEDTLNNNLKSLLIGTLECWIICTDEGKPIGILLTAFNDDFCSGTKSLILYTLWTIGGTTKKIWLDGWNTMKKYAKGRGCDLVISYSNSPPIIKMAELTGGEAKMTFLRWEV